MGRPKVAIPKGIADEFIAFITELRTVSVKNIERPDEDGEMQLYQRETVEKPIDFKAALAYYEKKYPLYFDAITLKRMEQIEFNMDGSGTADIAKEIKEALKVNGNGSKLV